MSQENTELSDRDKNNLKDMNKIVSNKLKLQKSDALTDFKEHHLAKLMKKSLSDVLHEGLLDSVLPYMLPKQTFSQPIIKKPVMNTEAKKSASLTANLDKSITMPSANREKDKDKGKSHKKSLE